MCIVVYQRIAHPRWDFDSGGPLCAVLAGHIHSAQVQALAPGVVGGSMQLVTEAGCNDGYRLIDFVPATGAAL